MSLRALIIFYEFPCLMVFLKHVSVVATDIVSVSCNNFVFAGDRATLIIAIIRPTVTRFRPPGAERYGGG